MNKILLTLLFGFTIVGTVVAQQEYEIHFSYDSAGNQTLRDRVCVNCQSSSREEPIDSTEIVEIDLQEDILDDALALEDETFDSRVMAHPNPVTNVLSVEWVDNQKQVSQIILFSGIGRQLYKANIDQKQGNLDLNFANYPTGRYIIYVQYADRSKKAFHIIKK